MMDTVYLGDGLYVEFNGYQVVLRANDPYEPTDIVYLEREVWEALFQFVSKFWEAADDNQG